MTKKVAVKADVAKSNVNAPVLSKYDGLPLVSSEAAAVVVAAAGDDLYTKCVEILTTKADTPMNVLAGRLKTNMATAQKLRSQFLEAKHASNGHTAVNLGVDDPVLEYARTRKVDPTTGRRTLADDPAKIEALEEAKEQDDKAERLTELSATVSKKKPAPAKLVPPEDAINAELIKSRFTFIQAQESAQPGGTGKRVAYGYSHADGRAVMYVPGAGYKLMAKNGLERGGTSVKELQATLASTATKSLCNKALASDQRRAKRLAADQAKTEAAVAEGRSVLDLAAKGLLSPQNVRVETIDGVPSHVVRAVEMLGGLTLQRFDLDLLRGDKYYGKRMALLKQLFKRDRILAKECGINNLTEAFYSAIGVEGRSAAAKSTAFAKRCKEVSTKIRTLKSAATRAEKAQIAQVKRATVMERTVPGTILDTGTPMSKKARAAYDNAARREVIYSLAVTAEQYPVPKPDAEVVLDKDSIRLLEDPTNGIAMMQLEPANSQGAICVYNNGVRVACGVIPNEKLNRLRPITREVDELIKAANQLLNPIVPSVAVTPVAARHLTAVLNHCKEIVAMTASAAVSIKSAKFAPPAKTGKKGPVAVPSKKEATKKAPKEKVERVVADREIKALKKKNELREGTFCFAQVNAALSSKTVSEAQAKLDKDKKNPKPGRRIEIAWLAKQGYIKVV
jgi:hypothetical protein